MPFGIIDRIEGLRGFIRIGNFDPDNSGKLGIFGDQGNQGLTEAVFAEERNGGRVGLYGCTPLFDAQLVLFIDGLVGLVVPGVVEDLQPEGFFGRLQLIFSLADSEAVFKGLNLCLHCQTTRRDLSLLCQTFEPYHLPQRLQLTR